MLCVLYNIYVSERLRDFGEAGLGRILKRVQSAKTGGLEHLRPEEGQINQSVVPLDTQCSQLGQNPSFNQAPQHCRVQGSILR